MALHRYIFVSLLLAGTAHAGDELRIVLLDSKTGHALRGKLVCIAFPAGASADPVITQPRDCRRTDSTGTATFAMPDTAPEHINIMMGSDGLVGCFTQQAFATDEAMTMGVVVDNTCGDASTETTQPGEVVVFAHQTSVWEALKARRNEF